MKRTTAYYALVLLLLVILSLLASGCGGGVLSSFTGGGLPPGETDLGGQVLAQSTGAALAPQATVPVVGANVVLYHGSHLVGDTTTGPNGYFKFVNPDSGNYKIAVNPPVGAKLKGADLQVVHTKGQKTFVTIILPPA